MLRAFLLAAALIATPAAAQTPVTVAGTPALEGRLWLPPSDGRVPFVLLLHGAGGGWADHAPLAAALAGAGIAAAAFTQVADRAAPNAFARMAVRARDAGRVLDHLVAAEPRIDAARIGVFGYSAGATAALLLAGGRADPARWPALCAAAPEERLCASPFGQAALAAARDGAGPFGAADARIRAAILAAPALGFLFAPDGLAPVPPATAIRIWRAGADTVLAEPHHAEAIAPLLPGRPVPQVVEGAGHWVFLPPCDAERHAALPFLCADPPGQDRAAFLAAFHADAIAFFSAALAGTPP
ncbi:dienelactone hydrolase [Roseomonas sp. HF4]|uniref:dienelactone hydrolase n=1 Tax=Roseomonas sp. HF4 TaxID=2562313 RepID=UPI0010C0C037|nr:dienelactone hydrolase [Roseomonas sp. HF4]